MGIRMIKHRITEFEIYREKRIWFGLLTVIPTVGLPAFRANIAERFDRDPEEVVLISGIREADSRTCMEASP